MRVVLDTNVLLAGIATHGLCEGLVMLAFRDHAVVLSEHILGEVARHYVGKFKATAQQAEHVVAVLRSQGEMIEPVAVPAEACDDADDLPVLGTALAAKAECLVTGDQGLLKLASYEGIPILSPRVFYDRIRADA
ncbi:MAG: putative toxin-antitoxin system toxin component, PIN family [Planctomycetes bacterium]|nr:putative toxin-antitoxin system toxin component, PIN family [Planctomycetota bacterium]